MLGTFTLAGCAGDPGAHADALAKAAGMAREQVTTDSFLLTTFSRISRPDQPLNIYIEGDGPAWMTHEEPSINPTPHKALGLALAASDPAANVIYIARPCQFTPLPADRHCNVSYWTGKRFAPEVIAATSRAIDHFAARAPGQKINLVGYSGGGTVAALVAASRPDIATLRTIAGNLDPEAFNRLHEASPMPDSLSPLAIAAHLASLPQEHFVGDADRSVPPSLIAGYAQAMGGAHCLTVTHVPDATHEEGWLEFWRGNVARLPTCHP
jgi:pimeloyl-ACP methyl ester carboxylesterase